MHILEFILTISNLEISFMPLPLERFIDTKCKVSVQGIRMPIEGGLVFSRPIDLPTAVIVMEIAASYGTTAPPETSKSLAGDEISA